MVEVGIYTPICEEDKDWIPQYLKECERLNFPFAIHLDRYEDESKEQLINHRLCVGYSESSRIFNERHRGEVFNIIKKQGFDFALNLDIDEVLEKRALEKLHLLEEDKPDSFTCPWLQLWEDDLTIRSDLGSLTKTRFYRVKGIDWEFRHPNVNGAIKHGGTEKTKNIDIKFYHHGLKTKKLRLQHKKRWDYLYGIYMAENPYGLWNTMLDESGLKTTTIEEEDR